MAIAGYECVLHIHSLAMECKITRLVSESDKKTGKPAKKVPTFIKNGSIAIVRIVTDETIAVENFKDFPQLGRFTLRDEGKTIGIGKIMRIKEFTK
jgi:peptide chain release factor subunit 3